VVNLFELELRGDVKAYIKRKFICSLANLYRWL